MITTTVLLFWCFSWGHTVETDGVYLKRASLEDQVESASSYAYHSGSYSPSSYVHFTDSSGKLVQYGYPHLGHYSYGIPDGGDYGDSHLNYKSYYDDHDYSQYYPSANYGLDHSRLSSYTYSYPEYFHGYSNYGTGGGGGGHHEDYSKGGGSDYDSSKHSSHGSGGDSGYKVTEDYDKGQKGEHAAENHKGHYAKGGGSKKGHHEAAEHYGSKHAAAKASQGESSSKANSHKKGSKTTGYHKIYHKDEFKKDHSFYDDADNKGHFDKYGSSDSHHSSEKGGHEKGGSANSGYKGSEHGQKGAFSKGHYLDTDSGYKGEKGSKGYQNEHSDYGQNGGHDSGNSFGYSDDDGGKYHHHY